MIPLLVDERRLAAGIDARLGAETAQAPRELFTPATLLERFLGVRVIGESEWRAVIRRIAATRDDISIPPHILASASFAARVAAAIDGSGERAPFETVIEHYATLLAFASVLDVPDALRRALAGERGPIVLPRLAVDQAVFADEERAFAWRRLCAAAGIALEPLDLGPVSTPVFDASILEGVEAFFRYAASERDDDARRAIVARPSGVRSDDARALLSASAGRAPLIETIDSGKVSLGPTARADTGTFARGLRAVARAYSAQDASAGSVLAAIGNAFALDDEPTVAALVRVAQAFDRARTLGPMWDAAAFIAEIDAELHGARRPAAPFHSVAAPAVHDEPRRPVPLRRAHFSASSLNAFAECARKWYFRYVCAAVEDRGSSASFYGTAFHAALEDFHTKYARVDESAAAALGSYLDGCVVSAFDRYRGRFDAPVEFELQRRRARRTAKKYLSWLIERARREPFVVIGNEVSTDLDLEGNAFVGFIDRLDRDERTGSVTVVDYKTGTIAASAAEYRDDVAAFREFQLPFYYWARTAAGDRVTKLALIPLKDALLDVAPIELEITPVERPRTNGRRYESSTTGTISIAELERARAKMIEYATLLSGATLEAYPATDDPDACRYCAYRDACRERPLVAEERFGR
ncbi:MAG: hypothetical protein NVSMB64_26980 [Candidatus Velthaea sp.]